MNIIISPAKKMQVQNDGLPWREKPVFLQDAKKLHQQLKSYDRTQLQQLFMANQTITEENYRRYQAMDLERNLTPALLAYVGLQYQYMAPHIFSQSQWQYACRHLHILSGFYGILHADDGIVPYRLEMQAKLMVDGKRDLYEFWKDRLYGQLVAQDRKILNLASREYSKAIEPWLTDKDHMVSCTFGTMVDGKVKVKATEAKMARGEMVRWLAENQIEDLLKVKHFDRLGFVFCDHLSGPDELVFIKEDGRDKE